MEDDSTLKRKSAQGQCAYPNAPRHCQTFAWIRQKSTVGLTHPVRVRDGYFTSEVGQLGVSNSTDRGSLIRLTQYPPVT